MTYYNEHINNILEVLKRNSDKSLNCESLEKCTTENYHIVFARAARQSLQIKPSMRVSGFVWGRGFSANFRSWWLPLMFLWHCSIRCIYHDPWSACVFSWCLDSGIEHSTYNATQRVSAGIFLKKYYKASSLIMWSRGQVSKVTRIVWNKFENKTQGLVGNKTMLAIDHSSNPLTLGRRHSNDT